ncbi:amino acid permease [Brachybacterium hainanense]|uniref:Amino acid permease n=1 Tax=Brachybacterium hainanense TaxID=1541174 RepID=A0ABV6RFY1_9MICO
MSTTPAPPPASSPAEAPGGALARSLSHGQMAMIAMGSALGTGLFLGSGAAIGMSGPAVILCFALGSAIAATIALSMGEMSSRYPVRGGFGTLAARFLSPYWGYLTRWLYWFVTICVTGAELVACATYLRYWASGVPLWAGILLFAAIILAINLTSVGSFGVVEFWLSSIKVVAVLVFILIGIFLVVVGLPSSPAPGLTNLTADGGFLPFGIGSVWIAMSVVMFSFGGIELLSITAAEAKDPGAAIRTAARTTIIRLAFFYVLAVGVVVALLPWREASGQGEEVTASPFVLVFDRIGIPGAASLTNVIVLIAALSAANANLYAGSRMLHSLSADAMAPAFLSRLSRRHVPVRGIAVSSAGIVLAAALAFTGVGGVFGYMMALVVFSVLLVWALILVSYLFYRRTRDGRETFRLPGGAATAAAGLIGVLGVFSTIVVVRDLQLAALVGVPAVAIATALYLLVVRHRIDPRRTDAAFAEAEAAEAGTAGRATGQEAGTTPTT